MERCFNDHVGIFNKQWGVIDKPRISNNVSFSEPLVSCSNTKSSIVQYEDIALSVYGMLSSSKRGKPPLAIVGCEIKQLFAARRTRNCGQWSWNFSTKRYRFLVNENTFDISSTWRLEQCSYKRNVLRKKIEKLRKKNTIIKSKQFDNEVILFSDRYKLTMFGPHFSMNGPNEFMLNGWLELETL